MTTSQALLAAVGVILAAIIGGYFTLTGKIRELRVTAKKNESDAAHLLVTDLSEERRVLREELKELREEVRGLRGEVLSLTNEVKLHQDGRQQAEARLSAVEGERDTLRHENENLRIQLDAALRGQDMLLVEKSVERRVAEARAPYGETP